MRLRIAYDARADCRHVCVRKPALPHGQNTHACTTDMVHLHDVGLAEKLCNPHAGRAWDTSVEARTSLLPHATLTPHRTVHMVDVVDMDMDMGLHTAAVCSSALPACPRR